MAQRPIEGFTRLPSGYRPTWDELTPTGRYHGNVTGNLIRCDACGRVMRADGCGQHRGSKVCATPRDGEQ